MQQVDSFRKVLSEMATNPNFVAQFDNDCTGQLSTFGEGLRLLVENRSGVPDNTPLAIELDLFVDYTLFFVYMPYAQRSAIRRGLFTNIPHE